MINPLKTRLDAGKSCANGWLGIPSGFSAELMAQCGWDSITVDLQHGVQDYQSMVECFQAMGRFPVTPLARVPWNEPGIIGKTLDAGAWGVICPMINDAAEAKALADACFYPPLGRRSNGPIRWGGYDGAPYQPNANSQVLAIAMIETREGIDNIDAILSVPGISGIYVGPSDMRLALGLSAVLDTQDQEILDIYAGLIAACRRHGKFAGLHTLSAAYSAQMSRMGFQLCTVGSDATLLVEVASGAVSAFRRDGVETVT